MTEIASAPDESPLPLLILASQSPGRARILRDAGLAFETIVSDVDEDAALESARSRFGELSPADVALLLARAKAEAVAGLDAADGAVVLGCDSVFELHGIGYGKPYTEEETRRRWVGLRGQTGVLHSGHWLIDNRAPGPEDDAGSGVTDGAVASAAVTFGRPTDEEVARYAASGEPLHCAGAFTIDGRASAFIERVEGDPHAVVGLSVSTLRGLLEPMGLSITDLWE
ncbi:Maf family protein [Zhihengliuella flava]|uniref:Nucleoside triphosphate pyrophosphatase n=1 Tax=Zhihengliuella flava TaxID=1285193 RepID=A0A931DBX7_9MICC|nr:Maf family protein [Zhihengliuella flava]MBG6083925.1 septum formation protein [Zhihengliuella flava]